MSRPDRLGPYRIEEPIGKGGMGHVYAAVHEETGERVAIKALSPELAMAEGFRERFESEIESLRILRHAGIVELYGYGEHDGTLFYSMELVTGASLEEELRAGRRFNWREVTQIAVQVCRALKHAHDHGVIHRDIKPANILINSADRVKLADFGIARLFGSTQLTTAGGVLGTADYMSPEQADGRPVNDRCDQYSLGCVMYALLAGRPPFRARTLPEMLQMQRYAAPEPVSRYAPQTPKHLETAIAQLLSKQAADRFPNTSVLARHLEAMMLALSKPAQDDFHLTEPGEEEREPAIDDIPATRLVSPSTESDSSGGTLSSSSAVARVREQDTRSAPTISTDTQDADSQGGDEAEDAPPAGPSFTVVGVDDAVGADEERLRLVVYGAILVLLIGAIGYGAYSLLRPATANELFAQIEATSEAEWANGARQARNRLEEFLRRFPGDPRAAQLEPLKMQLEGSELERRLRTASLWNPRLDDRLTASEQLYVSALRLAKADPVAAIERFEQIEQLLNAGSDSDEQDPLAMLAVARGLELQQQLDREATNHLPFAQQRLASAQAAANRSPDEAAAICRALISLYGDRPWAAEVVAEARRLLDSLTTDSAPTTSASTSTE